MISIVENSNSNIDDMSKSELKVSIIDMLNEIKSEAVKLNLNKDIFNANGKETYYEIRDIIYDTLNNQTNLGFYTDKWYAFIIDNQIVFFYDTNRSTMKFFFTNSGFTWSITKNGKTNLDRAWDKLVAMKQLYSIANEYLNN